MIYLFCSLQLILYHWFWVITIATARVSFLGSHAEHKKLLLVISLSFPFNDYSSHLEYIDSIIRSNAQNCMQHKREFRISRLAVIDIIIVGFTKKSQVLFSKKWLTLGRRRYILILAAFPLTLKLFNNTTDTP